MPAAKIPNSEIIARLKAGQAIEQIWRETKASKDRIRKLKNTINEFSEPTDRPTDENDLKKLQEIFRNGDSKLRPCEECIHSHFEEGNPNNNCDIYDCTFQPKKTMKKIQDGINEDEIGTKYDPNYDLLAQIQNLEERYLKSRDKIQTLKDENEILKNRPTDSTTDRPTDVFDPATKEKFFEWIPTQNFPANSMFNQFKKFRKRASFSDVLALYEIFLTQQPQNNP